jgi:hypothetical protein
MRAERPETQNILVGPYRLVREIVAGGWSGWPSATMVGNRPAALPPHRAWRYAQLAERMARGAKFGAEHWNIATLYDGIASDGQTISH